MARVDIPEKDISYYMDNRLKNSLDKKVIPALQKKDKDFVMVIDGTEGAGKSTLAFQIGKYIDNSLGVSRICFDAEKFKKAIFEAKKGQCVIYDEAFTGLSSRASLSGINRMLVSLMMQMRQKNLMVIVVLPTFFLLDKYVALFRANCLIHVYESGGRRGYFKLYNRKNKKFLYLSGKITYNYKVDTLFKGRFYGVFALGDEKVEKEYRKIKSDALEKTDKLTTQTTGKRYFEQRNWLLYHVKKHFGITLKDLEKLMDGCKYPVTYSQISRSMRKYGENED